MGYAADQAADGFHVLRFRQLLRRTQALPGVVAKVISDFKKQDQSPIVTEKYPPAILSPRDSPLPATSLPLD
jgi:hypothetical protein